MKLIQNIGLFFTILLLCFFQTKLFSQTGTSPNVSNKAYEKLRANIYRTGGTYFVNDFSDRDNTPAPKGFTPFYISMYSRHGARYILEESDYELIYLLLSEAYGDDNLTDTGLRFYNDFSVLYEAELKYRAGDLTDLGKKQHTELATRMYNNYPSLFGAESHIDMFSSTTPRCILSMMYFAQTLKGIQPKLNINADVSNKYMDFLNPFSSSAPSSLPFDRNLKNSEMKSEFMRILAEKVDFESVSRRFFKVTDREGGYSDFILAAYNLFSDMQCLGEPSYFDYLFTEDELISLWECDNPKIRNYHPIHD